MGSPTPSAEPEQGPAVLTTGHTAEGLSVFVESEPCKPLTPSLDVLYRGAIGADGCVETGGDADLAALRALGADDADTVSDGGFVVVAAEWPAGSGRRGRMHRLDSVGIGVVVGGEVECHLDSGQYRTLRAGDVLIQRGTTHTWVNPSLTQSARMVSFVVPARPCGNCKR